MVITAIDKKFSNRKLNETKSMPLFSSPSTMTQPPSPLRTPSKHASSQSPIVEVTHSTKSYTRVEREVMTHESPRFLKQESTCQQHSQHTFWDRVEKDFTCVLSETDHLFELFFLWLLMEQEEERSHTHHSQFSRLQQNNRKRNNSYQKTTILIYEEAFIQIVTYFQAIIQQQVKEERMIFKWSEYKLLDTFDTLDTLDCGQVTKESVFLILCTIAATNGYMVLPVMDNFGHTIFKLMGGEWLQSLRTYSNSHDESKQIPVHRARMFAYILGVNDLLFNRTLKQLNINGSKSIGYLSFEQIFLCLFEDKPNEFQAEEENRLWSHDSPVANERFLNECERTEPPDTPTRHRGSLNPQRVDKTPRKKEEIEQTYTPYEGYEGVTPNSPDHSVLSLIRVRSKQMKTPNQSICEIQERNRTDANNTDSIETPNDSCLPQNETVLLSPKALNAWAKDRFSIDEESENTENFIIIKRGRFHRSNKYRAITPNTYLGKGKCGRNCSLM